MARPPRIVGFCYLGPYRYFLTFCARNRESAFRTEEVVNKVLVQFRRTARDEAFAILAYCFMPDHAHLLVEGTRDDFPHSGSDVWTMAELIESIRET